MAARRGDTLLFERMPVIASHAAVGGKKAVSYTHLTLPTTPYV